MCASFTFGFVGGMLDLIVLVPEHCLSFYFDAMMNKRAIDTVTLLLDKHCSYGLINGLG